MHPLELSRLAIDWRLTTSPILSTKDKAGKPLKECEVYTQSPILAMKQMIFIVAQPVACFPEI